MLSDKDKFEFQNETMQYFDRLENKGIFLEPSMLLAFNSLFTQRMFSTAQRRMDEEKASRNAAA